MPSGSKQKGAKTSEDRDVNGGHEMPDYLLRHLTLRQLQIFEAIVRLGSYTNAAEELFLTQPTVSMQIKKLTDTIGLPLFEQIDRKTRPTQVGEELYQVCKGMFNTLRNLESSIASYKGLQRGRLRLGVITTAKYFAPEVLGGFCDEYPEIDVSLKVTNRERVLERIAQGEDDLFVLGQVPDEGGLVAIPFACNPMVVVASKNHPLTQQRDITLERLAEEPLILREPGSGIRDRTMRLFREQNLQPRVRMELGSNEAIKHAVVGGLGISLLSLHTLSLEGATGPVDILDVEGFPIMRQWFLVYPKDRELSVIAQAFLEYAEKKGPEINAHMEKLLADFNLIHQERWRSLNVK